MMSVASNTSDEIPYQLIQRRIVLLIMQNVMKSPKYLCVMMKMHLFRSHEKLSFYAIKISGSASYPRICMLIQSSLCFCICLFSKKKVFWPLKVSYTILMNRLMNNKLAMMSTRMTRTIRYYLDHSWGCLSISVMLSVENWTEKSAIMLSKILSNLKSVLIHSPP